MSASEHAETPAQALARRIVERLVKEQLLSADDANAIQPKLAEGKLRGEDWRLPIELNGAKEGNE